jgi:hypothetical protein
MSGHAIFINHRREDAPDATERIYDRLAQEFTARAVFKDSAALHPGQNWEHAISATLAECRVVLAIIGPNWLRLLRERDPARPDYVRLELEWAHKAGVQIVPVLANFDDKDALPTVDDLPDTLSFLPALQVARVRRQDFHADMARLISALKEGDLTGVVEVETPTSGPGAAAANWQNLRDSIDSADLRRFAESFPGTNESLEARRRADRLDAEAEALKRVDWRELHTVEIFLRDWPKHPEHARVKEQLKLKRLEQTKRAQAEAVRRDEKERADAIDRERRSEESRRHAEETQEHLRRIEREAAHSRALEFEATERQQRKIRRREMVASSLHTMLVLPLAAVIAVVVAQTLGALRFDEFAWEAIGNRPIDDGPMPGAFSEGLGIATWLLVGFVVFFILRRQLPPSLFSNILLAAGCALFIPPIVLNWSDIFHAAQTTQENRAESEQPLGESATEARANTSSQSDAPPTDLASVSVPEQAAPPEPSAIDGFEFIGDWSGTVTQSERGRLMQYRIEASLSTTESDGAVWGRVDYPTLSCTGHWTGDPPSSGQTRWSVVENVDSGRCEQRVIVGLEILPDGGLRVEYRRRRDGPVVATGTMVRR